MRAECVCVSIGNDPKISLVGVFFIRSLTRVTWLRGTDEDSLKFLIDHQIFPQCMSLLPFLDLIPSLGFLFSPFFLISKSGTCSRGWEKGGDYYLSADAVGPFCTLRVGEKPRLNRGSGFRWCEKRNWKKLTLGRPSHPPLLRSYPHRSRRLKYYKNRVIDAPCPFLLSLSLSLFIIRCVVFFFD